MFKKILIALALLVLVFLGVVAMQPDQFRVTRSGTVAAPPATVFGHVNDFHKWEAWSPWAKIDPEMKQTYEGSPAGNGAIYGWSGNSQVGEGRMTLVESRTNELVRIRLEFIRPFASVNTTEFSFQPQGSNTTVTWSMEGTNNFISKAFCLFMNMDKTVGGDFEKGLAQLRTQAESAAKP